MTRTRLRIGPHEVGPHTVPFVIAEAGVHHDNSVSLAKEYILQARIAGAHAVKFQTYEASRLVTRWAPTYWDEGSNRSQFDVFADRSQLDRDDYAELFEYASELGIVLLSTPFDGKSAEILADLGMPAFKVASADITNWPLLRKLASYGRPMLLSTGASTLEEVESSVRELSDADISLAVLHCTLSYPTSVADANLRRIRALNERFPDLVLGYSDHTQPQDSELACPLAVALGARVIEKHFTLNKLLPGDDHYHAVDEAGLKRLVKNCADSYKMTSSFREVVDAEKDARKYARRSIVAARELPAGSVLSRGDIDFKRPGTGLPPTAVDQVLGKRLTVSKEEDELIRLEELGGGS